VDHSQSGGATVTSDHRVLRPLTPEQLAQQLENAAQVPAGAVRSQTAPTQGLRYPPDRPAIPGDVVRYRWWRIAMPWRAAYSWAALHQAAFLSGTSSSSSGPALTDNEKSAAFTPQEVPLSVNSATLTIAVVPLTATTSAIGAYAVVVRQPLRPAVENVPLTVNTVAVAAQRTNGNPGSGPIISNRTITGSQAQTLVRDFDELSVDPMEQTNCPLSRETESATFRADGHVWVATTGICVGAHVTVDGNPVATLNTSQPFNRDLRAALDVKLRHPADL
jgi:hypothetical protein